MTYTVLARRYRSGSFDQVIGQEPVARTLTSAIKAGRVAHAYLFSGTRGVGKTSMARIFARALNAPDTLPDAPKPPGDDDYPAEDVQQRMAEAIMRGDDLNVIEIDGASNNSVDQARQLIANAGLSPTGQAKYKVYIIDEVHMLSTAAFNALLKTMEEPPEHVKFILCTTEPHKVPATIQSRCQRFDFRNIATGRIAEHVRSVLEAEGVNAEEEAIWQVARLANGSMRDALSVLDRLIASGDQGLTTELIEQMLGLPPQEQVAALIDALAAGDVSKSLQAGAALLDGGIAQDQLLDTLIEQLRQMMLLLTCGPESELVEMSDDAKQRAGEQAKHFDAAGLVHMIALCENVQRAAKNSSTPRALLDAALVRLALSEKMADVTALLTGAAPAAPTEKKKVAADPPPAPEPAPQPAAPAPAPEPTAQAPQTADELWQRLLAEIGSTTAWAWLRSFRPAHLDERTFQLTARPGEKHMIRFATEARRKQLADQITTILGHPVKLELAAADTTADEPQAPARTNGRMTQEQRREAMQLPLVREVVDLFEASLLDVRPEPRDDTPDEPTESDDDHV